MDPWVRSGHGESENCHKSTQDMQLEPKHFFQGLAVSHADTHPAFSSGLTLNLSFTQRWTGVLVSLLDNPIRFHGPWHFQAGGPHKKGRRASRWQFFLTCSTSIVSW